MKKKKKETVKKDKYLSESGALDAFEEFMRTSKLVATHLELVTGMLSNLNLEAFAEHINIIRSEKEFDRPWQEIDRSRAYEWMSAAYRSVDALALYAHNLTAISTTLRELHFHAQDTVELTEKAFASAQVTTGMDLL